MATPSPLPPEQDVPLVVVPAGRITPVWWEWLQRYVKWDEACCADGEGGGGSGGVSDITGTPPVVVTGTSLLAGPEALSSGAVTISMPPATGSQNGYLTSANWTTFNGKANASHSHPESDVVNLVTDLAGKAALIHTHAESDVTGLVTDLALKAPLDSPALTGNPTAPTAALGDADTSIATTAFVSAAVSNTFTGGMSTAEYTYSTTTTTPPSTGQLRANTTTQTAITAFYLHETNAVGVDITNALKLITTGVKVLCQDKTNAANVQYYVVTGPAVDNGVYFTIPVTWTTGGSNFTAGRVIFAGFGIGSNNMPEAPTDGQIYGRRGSDSSWQVATGTFTDAPSDGAEYVRVDGVWRLKSQSLSPAGTSIDVSVPSGAKQVRIDGTVFMSTSAATFCMWRASLDGTTFLQGASDYSVVGLLHWSGSSGYVNLTAVLTTYGALTTSGDNADLPHQFKSLLHLTRPTTSCTWHASNNFEQYTSGASFLYGSGQSRAQLLTTSAGSNLSILKLRFSFGGGLSARAPSAIHLEWIY